jgi:hypothetical protein
MADTNDLQDAPRGALPGEVVPAEGEKGPKLPDISVPGPVPAEPVLQRPRCANRSRTGAACGAYAVTGSHYCFFHDNSPEGIAKRSRSQAKGNKRSNSKDGLAEWVAHPINTLQDLHEALSDLMNAGMAGDITTNRLTALSSVANALMKSIEGGDMEERIAALEEKLKVTEVKK